jgi:hypothetical protein
VTTRTSLLVALLSVFALAACGSSKPGYCSDTSNLEKSVSGLTDIKLDSNTLNQLESQLKQVESDAKAVVSSAKSDFPTETNAIDSSVNSLVSAINGLGSSPSPTQLATVPVGVKNVADSVSSFTKATESKCG